MPVRPKPFQVETEGPDDPGSTQAFASLEEVREYLEERLEWWDSHTSGHSDYMRYYFKGFTMQDIEARCDEDGWVRFDRPWAPENLLPASPAKSELTGSSHDG